MFAVGERVMHPGQGLCTVIGFQESPTPMLVLEAGDGRNTTRLMYPASTAEKNLHPPVSRNVALKVIDGYADLPVDGHTDRNSGLEEAYFKGLIKHGVPDSVRVVKTMRFRIADAERKGHKPGAYLTRVLKEAQRRSLEELSCALDSTPDEVASMFQEHEADMVEA